MHSLTHTQFTKKIYYAKEKRKGGKRNSKSIADQLQLKQQQQLEHQRDYKWQMAK